MNIIIVGGGKVGTALATQLLAANQRVRVIEARSEQLPPLQHDLPPEVVVRGSGTDLDVLQAAGIRGADVVVAVTGADEMNLVVASLARCEFNVPHTIARVNNPKNVWLFTAEMGVDVALDQTDLIAHLIAARLQMPTRET